MRGRDTEGIIERKTLGLAIIGSGRIGGLRAQLAAGHPAVRFIATADQDAKKAEAQATLAIEHSITTGRPVTLPMAG